jgi:spore photoproduct lyase
VRVFANLPEILQNNVRYAPADGPLQTFEASCYTDPLGIEHLTGGLAECIRWFGTQEKAHLRWVSKFDAVDGLLGLAHNGHTRCRASVNASPVARRYEGGVASVPNRLAALRKLALPVSQGGGGYPVGIVIAPIMPIPDWQEHYGRLLHDIEAALDFPCDLTFELITHRFTPGSRDTLLDWYPNTTLDLDPANRDVKRNKFGGEKYVYPKAAMKELRTFFETEIGHRFPSGRILYFT